MLAIAYYFLQVVICSGLMTAYYWIVLRNKRFHQYNRFFLLAIALLSWIVPLIRIQFNHQVVTADPQMIRLLLLLAVNNTQLDAGLSSSAGVWNTSLIPVALYFVVSGFLLFMMARALLRIVKLLRTHSCRSIDDVYLILTNAKGTPFSFFRYIFWNNELDLRSEAGRQILQHELTHVKQQHSIDKIFIQLVLVAGWFNPFFWLIKKEMEMIHEFIADKKAVTDGDAAALAQMLLMVSFPQQRFALTNPFFSPIRRRLQMLANNSTPRFSYLRRLVVLPMLALITILFAFRHREQRQDGTLSVASVMENVISDFGSRLHRDTIITGNGKTLTLFPGNTGTVTVQPLPAKVNVKRYSKLMPQVAMVIVDGKQVNNAVLETIDPALISTINVYKGADAVALYGGAAAMGVVVIHTKKPGTLALTDPEKPLQIKKAASWEGGTLHAATAELPGLTSITDTAIENSDSSRPLVIIDGVKGKLNSIAPNDIASVDVLKNAAAIAKYGSEGQHGVIEVTTVKKPVTLKLATRPDITSPVTLSNLTATNITASTIAEGTEVEWNKITQPQFPGGRDGYMAYMDRSLNKDLPRRNGAPPGNYTVIVTFEVGTDGSLSNIRAGSDPGYGTKEEAIRVIERGPRWTPAKYNGSVVRFNTSQRIVFKVPE